MRYRCTLNTTVPQNKLSQGMAPSEGSNCTWSGRKHSVIKNKGQYLILLHMYNCVHMNVGGYNWNDSEANTVMLQYFAGEQPLRFCHFAILRLIQVLCDLIFAIVAATFPFSANLG